MIKTSNEINLVDINEIIPYKNNTKKHDEGQVLQIMSSIREFGFTSPILIDEDNVIIAGHGRGMAAKELEMEVAPVIVIGYLTEKQKNAYRILDNTITLSTDMDVDSLIEEIKTLRDFNGDAFGMDALREMSVEELEEDLKDMNVKKTKKVMCKCPECGHEFEKGE